MTGRYNTQIYIQLVGKLARAGYNCYKIGDKLDMKPGTVRAFCRRNNIAFIKGVGGREQVKFSMDELKMLVANKLSSREIGKILDIKPNTVRNICRRHSISLLHPRGRPRTGRPIKPYRPNQKQTRYTKRYKVLADPFGEGKL